MLRGTFRDTLCGGAKRYHGDETCRSKRKKDEHEIIAELQTIYVYKTRTTTIKDKGGTAKGGKTKLKTTTTTAAGNDEAL